MNLADAQKQAREDPKVKAAVATSNRRAVVGAGITDDPDVDVELFTLVRDATAVFKGRKELLEKDGFSVAYGTVGRGLLILEREEQEFGGAHIPAAAVSMSLVRRPAKVHSNGG